ncbi:SWIM zinc finger domain protein [Nitzschia inconspicua]|uniref:SWIM zinc finger domain protein n=1 Tax=Nitzschia inconspicua TaxID=303405 RepID=A0A9K3KE48_9STRA|nr:SWIM zinc finger domain protein [Nitzschia inconspicua]
MSLRITKSQPEYEGKDGVVGDIVGLATKRWEKCVGCRVYASGNDGETYSVYQKLGEESEEALLKVRPVDCVCDCGKWQAIGVPCVHRPKTVRLRTNSRYAHEPEKSPTICSRCHQPGHNLLVLWQKHPFEGWELFLIHNDHDRRLVEMSEQELSIPSIALFGDNILQPKYVADSLINDSGSFKRQWVMTTNARDMTFQWPNDNEDTNTAMLDRTKLKNSIIEVD